MEKELISEDTETKGGMPVECWYNSDCGVSECRPCKGCVSIRMGFVSVQLEKEDFKDMVDILVKAKLELKMVEE